MVGTTNNPKNYTPEQIKNMTIIAAGFAATFFVFFVGMITGNNVDIGGGSTTTSPPTTEAPANAFEAIRNIAGNDLYFEDQNTTQEDLSDGFESRMYKAFHNEKYTERTSQTSNGSSPQGQARFICSVSHWAYDDPIILPDQPGASHLHQFFGNTFTSAFTTLPELLSNEGSGTCQLGALNRSSYWTPTVLDKGEGPDRNIVAPKVITLYYKSHKPEQVQPFPIGTQMLGGNILDTGMGSNESYRASERLHWGCYEPSEGRTVRIYSTIPGTGNTPACEAHQDIQATIQFPQCFATDNGRFDGNPILTSENFQDHTHILFNEAGNYGEQNLDCPASHPYRTAQISYLIRYANPEGDLEKTWRLSSDTGYENETVENPGMSLHGDWFGAWNIEAQQAWLDGCFINQSLNCSLGQTGNNGTGLKARPITGSQLNGQVYVGPQLIDDPSS